MSASASDTSENTRRDLRGTWPRALGSLAGAILMILSIRWAIFEPYVIPSGSMIPTLLVHDHILVNKFSYGIHLPFSTSWLLRFATPKRGDVIVFRSVDDSGVFLIKRVVGLPGDEILVNPDGSLVINGKPVPRRELSEAESRERLSSWNPEARESYLERYRFFEEDLDGVPHLTLRERDTEGRAQGPYQVPLDRLFMMGDNRDNSADSRVWGDLPVERVLGRASGIWLSCEETLPEMSQLCDPQTMRWKRIAKGIR